MVQHLNNGGCNGTQVHSKSQSFARKDRVLGDFQASGSRRSGDGEGGIAGPSWSRTRDEAEATDLVAELNELLGEPRYHDPGARSEAAARFDARVVTIFFDGMVAEPLDFESFREESIPLPPRGEPDGYRHALMLGTTGAGKTTLVRQIIGTDPDTERFPSTSTSRTTIHDTEVVLDDGPWRGGGDLRAVGRGARVS